MSDRYKLSKQSREDRGGLCPVWDKEILFQEWNEVRICQKKMQVRAKALRCVSCPQEWHELQALENGVWSQGGGLDPGSSMR